MYDSIFYVVCCNMSCNESGNIKKNFSKCPKCKKHINKLSLQTLNNYFCPHGYKCFNTNCKKLHPTKKHRSPPYISPCKHGINCLSIDCIFLHPNVVCNTWLVS